MKFGISRGTSTATLGKMSIQPQASTATAFTTVTKTPSTTEQTLLAAGNSKVSVASTFAAIAASSKANIQFEKFNFGLVKDTEFFRYDTRFNDTLPTVTAKFTPYEELAGISSARPEILTVSEFKPLYASNNAMITPSGEFLDAQVKLMNLRQQAIISLINDMKKDQKVAQQLDQQEGNFLLHVRNLQSRIAFLQNVQGSIEKITKLFDIRDASLKVDIRTLLSQYYRQVFDDINIATSDFSLYGYTDLLALHGFSKNRILQFSGTKIYLQILNEAKKMLRAGSDELLDIDQSLVSNDADPVVINRRVYKDPHVDLGNTSFPSLKQIYESQIHVSDTGLVTSINKLNDGFLSLDNAFAGATSDEISYTKKLCTITREYVYSKALSDATTIDLLKQYGYSISETVGNQQLFDAVYGQIGHRITDDRNNVNQNAMSAISSKIIDNTSVLTFEADYLQNDDGSTFTPGASYYINSVVRPSDNGFSLNNTADLTIRMNGVVDKYVDFLGKFNILPKKSNRILSQDAATQLGSDPIVLLNSLYQIYVEPSTGILKSDVVDTPLVNFLGIAATDSRLRANFLLYMYCVANISGDGLPDVEAARARAGQNTQDFELNQAEYQYTKVSGTFDKVIKNCLLRYKLLTSDTDGAASIEKSLRNFNEKALLSRIIVFIIQFSSVFNQNSLAVSSKGMTRYSTASDFSMIALALQLVLDSARRYAYVKTQQNLALNINANYVKSGETAISNVQSTLKQVVTPKMSSQISNIKGITPTNSITASAALATNRLFSKSTLKQAIETRLIKEDELTVKTAFAPLNLVKVCRDALEQFVLYLQNSSSISTLNDILRVVGDRKLVELLGDRGQVQILTDTMDDILSRVDPSSNANATNTDVVDVSAIAHTSGNQDDLKIFDDSFISSKAVNVLKAALADNAFNTQRGSNIRLLSVGLPHGFSTKLRNNFKISTFAEQVASKQKQSDIIILDVYKIDVRYPDLVFKPISKIFELSRFAVRNEKLYTSVNVGSGLNKALDAIPTKDYSNITRPTTTYGIDQTSGESNYDFMSKDDCQNMVRNHVLSFILEMYFRLMTGIPVSERELYIADPDELDKPAPFLTKAILTHAAENVFEVPLDSDFKIQSTKFLGQTNREVAKFITGASSGTGTQQNSTQVGNQKLTFDAFTQRAYNGVLGYAGAAADAGKKRTVYSDAEHMSKQILSPKLFERIFWLAVDPDDYEIDYEETMSSPIGQATFVKLQQAGEIEVQTTQIGQSSKDVYRMRDLRTSQQELVFEKYFITIKEYSPLSQRKI